MAKDADSITPQDIVLRGPDDSRSLEQMYYVLQIISDQSKSMTQASHSDVQGFESLSP